MLLANLLFGKRFTELENKIDELTKKVNDLSIDNELVDELKDKVDDLDYTVDGFEDRVNDLEDKTYYMDSDFRPDDYAYKDDLDTIVDDRMRDAVNELSEELDDKFYDKYECPEIVAMGKSFKQFIDEAADLVMKYKNHNEQQ